MTHPSGPAGTHPPLREPRRFILAARDYFEGAITAASVIVAISAIAGAIAWVRGQS